MKIFLLICFFGTLLAATTQKDGKGEKQGDGSQRKRKYRGGRNMRSRNQVGSHETFPSILPAGYPSMSFSAPRNQAVQRPVNRQKVTQAKPLSDPELINIYLNYLEKIFLFSSIDLSTPISKLEAYSKNLNWELDQSYKSTRPAVTANPTFITVESIFPPLINGNVSICLAIQMALNVIDIHLARYHLLRDEIDDFIPKKSKGRPKNEVYAWFLSGSLYRQILWMEVTQELLRLDEDSSTANLNHILDLLLSSLAENSPGIENAKSDENLTSTLIKSNLLSVGPKDLFASADFVDFLAVQKIAHLVKLLPCNPKDEIFFFNPKGVRDLCFFHFSKSFHSQRLQTMETQFKSTVNNSFRQISLLSEQLNYCFREEKVVAQVQDE